jgi:hypothetical protein
MLIREIKSSLFTVFVAKVQVQQPNYSQWIEVQISARNMQEAKKLLLAQYGPNAKVVGLRPSK